MGLRSTHLAETSLTVEEFATGRNRECLFLHRCLAHLLFKLIARLISRYWFKVTVHRVEHARVQLF